MEITLNGFAKQGIDLLIIMGGDGTVHGVLTCLFAQKPFSIMPLISIIPSGTTNMTALDFAIKGDPVKKLRALHRLLGASNVENYLIQRPVLRVEQGRARTRYGMFFGVGAIARGVVYFNTQVKKIGMIGEGASAIVMARFLIRALLGDQGALCSSVSVAYPGQDGHEVGGEQLLVFASALERLLLGLRPYWGREVAPIHATIIRRSPKGLPLALIRLFSGKGLRAEQGYISHNVSQLAFSFSDDYIIDGEVYSASIDDGPVRISADGPIQVLSI